MKRLLVLSLLLTISGITIAQTHGTHILSLNNYSRQDSLTIEKLIKGIQEENLIEKTLQPFGKRHKMISGDIFVVHKDGTHKISHFDSSQSSQVSLKFTSRGAHLSKGSTDLCASSSRDFNHFPDTLVLLDTLQIAINFGNPSYPEDRYFVTLTNQTKKIEHDLEIKDQILRIPLGWFDMGEEKFVTLLLSNRATSVITLWKAKIRSLKAADEQKIRQFSKNLKEALLPERKSELSNEVYGFIQDNYGPILNSQLHHWLDHTNF